MKKETVFYKLPIENMRGKLATKQDGIMYAGQSKGENTLALESGKHDATNFSKYIVLTVRRGINRFYVKSRTAIKNTVGTIYARVTLLLSMLLVDELYKEYKAGSVRMNAFRTSFDYWGQGMTFREYLSSVVIKCIRDRLEDISYKSVPNAQGVYTNETICSNPYKSFITSAPLVNSVNFASTASVAGKIQKNLRYFAAAQDASNYLVKVINSVTGSNVEIVFNGQSATTIGDIVSTLQGTAFSLEADNDQINNIVVRNEEGVILMQGTPYANQELTTPIAANTLLPSLTTMYL